MIFDYNHLNNRYIELKSINCTSNTSPLAFFLEFWRVKGYLLSLYLFVLTMNVLGCLWKGLEWWSFVGFQIKREEG